jgi:hypothetical protein
MVSTILNIKKTHKTMPQSSLTGCTEILKCAMELIKFINA